MDTDKQAITGLGDAVAKDIVYKFGRTSDYTTSTVASTGKGFFGVTATAKASDRADYTAWNGFSAKGDSGSAVFDNKNQWLGLLYAGDSPSEISDRATKCYAHAKILTALNDRSTNAGLAGSNGIA